MKKILKNIIIPIIVFLILFSLNLLLDLKYKFERYALETIVNVVSKDKIDKNDVIIKRYSLTNNQYRINTFNYTNSIMTWKITNYYYRKIKINVKNSSFDKILVVNVKIGNSNYNFKKKSFSKNNNDDFILIIDKNTVNKRISFFPIFKNALNFTGFDKIFFILFFKSLILTLVILIFMNIFRYSNLEYKYLRILFLFSIIILGLIFRLIINQTPSFSPDSSGYLEPALNFILNKSFISERGRSFLYPLFILCVFFIFRNLSAVTIVQHILGVSAGILLFFTWSKLYFFIKNENYKKHYHDIVGYLITILFVFNIDIIYWEHKLLIESIYFFFTVLYILLFIQNIIKIIKKQFDLLFFINMISFFFLCSFLYILQPRWGLNLFFGIFIYLIMLFFVKVKSYKKIIFLIVIPILLVVFLLFFPEKMKNQYTNEKSKSKIFLIGTMFYWQFEIIEKEITKDIKNKNFNLYEKQLLMKLIKYYSKSKHDEKYKKLGFNPDKLFHGECNDYLRNYFNYNNKKYKEFCMYYIKKSLIAHPLKYLIKITKELNSFYKIKGQIFYDAPNKKLYNKNTAVKLQKYENYIPLKTFRNNFENIKNKNIVLEYQLLTPLVSIYTILNYSYLILTIIFIIFFCFTFIVNIKNRKKMNNVIFPLIIFSIFLFSFMINVTVSMIHSFGQSRYIRDQFIINLLFYFSALLYIITFIRKQYYKIKKWKTKKQ